ncbi:MAG: hypothetical protein HY965_06460 [Ignavibacteriales bacterium]|nr:hypothetical protein [Ignavibacteriales bacterium]
MVSIFILRFFAKSKIWFQKYYVFTLPNEDPVRGEKDTGRGLSFTHLVYLVDVRWAPCVSGMGRNMQNLILSINCSKIQLPPDIAHCYHLGCIGKPGYFKSPAYPPGLLPKWNLSVLQQGIVSYGLTASLVVEMAIS